MMYPMDLIAVLSFLALLVWAAISDGTRFIIPNRICAGIALLYPVHVLTSPVPVPWMGALVIAVMVMMVGAFAFARGWTGGGDVKLLAACSLWAGPAMMSTYLFVTAIAGGVLALGAIGVQALEKRRPLRAGPEDRVGGEHEPARGKPVLPYGIAIATGGAFVAVQLLRG